jgi:hypothetical protein
VTVLGRTTGIVLSAIAGTALFASPAGAATVFGETFVPNSECSPAGTTFVQTGTPGPSYAAPSAGVITSWSFLADATPPQLKLKLVRPAGGNQYTTVGDSQVQAPAPNVVSAFPTRIPVQAGDILGLNIAAVGHCGQSPAPGYSFHFIFSDPPPGTTAAYSGPGLARLDMSAVLEPDCDNDGFGDESQDDAVDCVAPETTITKGPKNKIKTKKKRARATFEFSANESAATFECSLDDAPSAPCTSPHKVKVKKGKHSLSVRAKDAGNNVDGSPATDDFKVKRKK